MSISALIAAAATIGSDPGAGAALVMGSHTVIKRTLVLVMVLALGGSCGSSAPRSERVAVSPTVPPSGPPVLGIDWARATSVERPTNFEVDPSDPPYTGTHPILRIAGQAIMADVVRRADRTFVAVGYVPPDWLPAAWTSTDGLTWTIAPMGAANFTFPVSIATHSDGLLVAVGRSGQQAAAWTSQDGRTWQHHGVADISGVAERMNVVVATADGYLSGGSVGPELFDRTAAFWISGDGVAWRAVPNDPLAFANAEVRAITAVGSGFVAVGVVGSAQAHTAAVAWKSSDGQHWTRVDDPAFADGVAVAVTTAPSGGVVAVGSDVDRREAVAWTSADGAHWAKAPSEPARQHSGGYAWMTDVIAVDKNLIAIGDYQGLQRGTATSWVSGDGLRWQQARSAPVQEQGEFYAIEAGGPGVIVVGSFGAPDSYVPAIWVSPGR